MGFITIFHHHLGVYFWFTFSRIQENGVILLIFQLDSDSMMNMWMWLRWWWVGGQQKPMISMMLVDLSSAVFYVMINKIYSDGIIHHP